MNKVNALRDGSYVPFVESDLIMVKKKDGVQVKCKPLHNLASVDHHSTGTEACMFPEHEVLSIRQAQRLLESSFAPYRCRFIPDGVEHFGLEFASLTGDILMVVFGMPLDECRHSRRLGQLIAELHLALAVNMASLLPEQVQDVAA
jgi:hypothetical protein